MAFCRNCGAALQDGAHFCTACGARAATNASQQQTYKMNASSVDPEMQFDPQDVQQNKVNAVLAYLGILVLIPVFSAKDSKYARFHANQGLVLLICYVAYGMLQRILSSILESFLTSLDIVKILLSLAYLFFLTLSVIGIVSAARGKAQKLPIIGDFKILK